MIPTEHEYTEATHAAAKKAYELASKTWSPDPTWVAPPWDALLADVKREYLEAVLPIVDAAISAIPDRSGPGFQAGALWAYDVHPGDPMPDEEVDKAAREYTSGLTR